MLFSSSVACLKDHLPARDIMRKKKKKSPIPLLDEIEKLHEQHRPKMDPLYPYDRKKDTIHLPPEVVEELKFILLTGNKVAAIKRVLELTGAGLRLSKDYVDDLSKSVSR